MTKIYSHARVSSSASIRRRYPIPTGGFAKVSGRDSLRALEPIATVEKSRGLHIIDLAEAFDVKPEVVRELMIRLDGETVEAGEAIAVKRRLLGRKSIVSPVQGKLIKVYNGLAVIEEEVDRTEIPSPVPGQVVDVEQREHVIIETSGGVLQLPWSNGRSTWGTLRMLSTEPVDSFDLTQLDIEHRGMIVAIAGPLNEAILTKAFELNVKAVIGSTIRAREFQHLMAIDIPFGLTDGFGYQPMNARFSALLNTFNGREVALVGNSDPDWRERPPVLIIPAQSGENKPSIMEVSSEFRVGHRVRLWQTPHWGEIGTIVSIPDSQHQLETGLWTTVAVIELADKHTFVAALANLQQLD